MKLKSKQQGLEGGLTGLLVVLLLCLSAILFAANFKAAPEQSQTKTGAILQEPPLTLGNYPNTSIPLSTDTTVTPDAAPTNTTSITVSTSTNFQGQLEGYPNTGVVRVTDAHPSGTYTVTVRAFNLGVPTTTKTFTLTVTTPPTCTPVSLAAPRIFGAGIAAGSMALGDFNGDGKQDIAVAQWAPGMLSVALGDGTGNFGPPTTYNTGSGSAGVAIGDFNGDGKQDIAVINVGSSNVSIFIGDGTGTFNGPTNYPTDILPYDVAVGDFNGDGKQDLAVAASGGFTVSILLGDGAGHFSSPTNFNAGVSPQSVVVGDFNNDGKQDVAVINDYYPSTDRVSILLGDGAGNLGAPTAILVGTNADSIALADLNGDGNQDLVVANYESNNISILLGNGTGHFGAPTNVAAGSGPSSLVVGDFDADGHQDLAVGNGGSNVLILFGNGMGGISGTATFPAGLGSGGVLVGDFDGNGWQDLAVSNVNSAFGILLRQCLSPTPTATSTATATPTATGTPPPPPTLGNYPDRSILLSTDTLITPDIRPVSTVSITVSASTNFKGTLTADPATGVVRVTDAHPAGTYPVTLRAFNAIGLTTTRTFTLTVTTPPSCSSLVFAAPANFNTGTSPQSLVVGDFNNDGKQDLAEVNTNFGSNTVSILFGDGAGNFSTPSNFPSAIVPDSVAVGDFNGDGNQDLAVSNNDSNNVAILLGDGAGNFSAPVYYVSASRPSSLAVSDFNLDGKQDLVVANADTDNIAILLGDGAGHFSAPVNYAAGNYPLSVAVGDFNGDGKQDVVTMNYYGYDVSILLGDGAGHFSAPVNYAVGNSPISLALGDFNGDGKQDLVTANAGAENVSILLGDGAGHFSAAANAGLYDQPIAVAVGDFNGDGLQDLAVTNGDNVVSILLGDGAGNFSAPTQFFAASYPNSIAVGDFNGDGLQDLATTNRGSNNISVLLRLCPIPTPSPTPITLTVTTINDSGPGSLRQVLADANNGDTIQFDPLLNGQTITLTTAELLINKNITISGPGPGLLRVSGSHQTASFRIFHLVPGSIVGISGLTISGGQLVNDNGGGILNDHATLTITNCAISGNGISAWSSVFAGGGGIYNINGTVSLINSTVSGNSASGGWSAGGGGISSSGTLTITQSSISGNFAHQVGGGIVASGILTISDSTVNNNQTSNLGHFGGNGGGISSSGTLIIQNSTVRDNSASGEAYGGQGGGITNSGSADITNSTISGNTANWGGGIYGWSRVTNSTISGNSVQFDGGGIYTPGIVSNSTISGNTANHNGGGTSGGGTITNSTISGNTAHSQGGGIYASSQVVLGNTILKTGSAGTNIFNNSTVTSLGYNLSNDNGGGFLTGPGDQINTDPILGPLQNNGGPTFTHVLLNGSSAINAGDPGFTPPPSTDQRGYPRVYNGRIDIGSVEVQPIPTPSPTPTPSATPTPTPTPTPCLPMITQSSSQAITTANSASCNDGNTHTDNSYWRAFDMNAFANGGQYCINSVSFGVEFANATQPVTVRLYTTSNFPAGFPGSLTQIGATTVNVGSAQNGTVVTTPLVATVPAGIPQLVMELFTPNGQPGGYRFFVGSNAASESGASYWSAPACGFSTPTTTSAIGFPNMHIVLDVNGTCSCLAPASPTPTPTLTPSPTPSCSSVISNSTSQAITTPAPWCLNPPPMVFPYDNHYWRAFNMQHFVGGAEYTVNSVSFGAFLGSAAVIVRLYANNGAPFPAETGTQIGISTLTVTSGQGGTVVTTPLVATVPAGTSELVMELHVPEGGGLLQAGANAAPETGPSYWSSIDKQPTGCSSTPQVISSHLVFNVQGTCPGPSPTPTPCPIFNVTGTVGQCTTTGPSGIALPGVTITRTGSGGDASTITDASGFYFMSGFSCVTNTLTPSKAALTPGSAGIDTVDVIAIQKHFLIIGAPLAGCRLTAANVNSDGNVNTVDVIATQKFFLGLTSGTANVGTYRFTPASRSYSPPINNQTDQNYDAIVFGDVAAPFAQ